MGWFLSKQNPGQKKRKTTKGRGAKAAAWDPQRTLQGLKLLGVSALLVALVIGWTTTERVLGHYASSHRSAPVLDENIVLIDAPVWMDATLRSQLQTTVADAATGRLPSNLANTRQTPKSVRTHFNELTQNLADGDPLQGRGLEAAALALRHEPWISQVQQVRRTPGGIIKVTATYRQPAAIIADRNGYHLIDTQGVWLDGPINRATSRWSNLPLITGVSAGPPTAYGQTWKGSDYTAALNLYALLAHEPYAPQITAYDTSHRDQMGRLWLVLYTNGPAVVWGLPPGDERSIEPQAPIKISALRDWALAHHGRIDTTAEIVWVYTGTAQIDARPSTICSAGR